MKDETKTVKEYVLWQYIVKYENGKAIDVFAPGHPPDVVKALWESTIDELKNPNIKQTCTIEYLFDPDTGEMKYKELQTN